MPTYCYRMEKIETQVNRLQSICNPVYQDLGSTTKREQCPSPTSYGSNCKWTQARDKLKHEETV